MAKFRTLFLIVVVAIPALFFGLGKRALWNPVEPRYASICAEMQQQETWLVPTYNLRPYDQKPALFFWLGAASLSMAHDSSSRLFFVRLPSALGGLLLVLGTWVMGHELLDKKKALMAALLATTCWINFWSSRFCHLDTLFAASVTWALYFSHRLLRLAPGPARIRAMCCLILSFVFGLMLKGPGILAFVVVTFLLLAAMERSWSSMKRSGILWGIPGALLVAALWFIPAWIQAGNGWAKSLLYDAGVMHLFDPTNKPKHTIFYYPIILFVLLAPWSFLAPALLGSLWRRKNEAFAGNKENLRFVVAWCFGIVLVLYTGTTYRSRYLIPLVAPFSICMSEFLGHVFRRGERRSSMANIGIVAMIALLLVMGLSFVFPNFLAHQFSNPAWARFFAVLGERGLTPRVCGLVVVLFAVLSAGAVLRSRFKLAFGTMILAIVLTFASWSVVGVPVVDACSGDDRLLAVIRSNLGDGTRLVAVASYAKRESTEGYFHFEVGQNLECVAEDEVSLGKLLKGDPCLLLLRQRDLERIGEARFSRWQKIGNQALGRHKVRIYRNSPALGLEGD